MGVETLETETLEALAKIRESLKQKCEHFPEQCCDASSSEIFRVLGFVIFSGKFRSNGRITSIVHYWNVSPDRKIADLTAGQFGDFPDVYILDMDSPEAREHYLYGKRKLG